MSRPTRYWITSGTGESELSDLDALDKAFMNAGLGYQNHIAVSSIPPVTEIFPDIDKENGITYVSFENKRSMIPFSMNIYVVKSLTFGKRNDFISTAIALAKIFTKINGEEIPCMLAFESKGETLDEAKAKALEGVKSMISERVAYIDSSWGNSGFKFASSSLVITKKYGCSVSFIVFDPFTYQNE